MAGKFNYEKRFKYPHLVGEDNNIWERFIDLFPDRFDTVDYDVQVGQGAKVFSIEDEKDQEYWTKLTKKRIDVVAHKDGAITIIEIKKRTALATLGQILGYRFLYLREHPELNFVNTLVVSGIVDQDDADVLKHYGISFLVV